jgi:hypothetical protein
MRGKTDIPKIIKNRMAASLQHNLILVKQNCGKAAVQNPFLMRFPPLDFTDNFILLVDLGKIKYLFKILIDHAIFEIFPAKRDNASRDNF